MSPTIIQHYLGLPVEPYGDAGQLLILSPSRVPLVVLTPHGAVGGEVRYTAKLILDLAELARRAAA